MNAKSLGTLLRDWRIERDLTQEQLGKAAGLSRKIIGSIELGDRDIKIEEVVKVCRALGRNAEELVLHWSTSFLAEIRETEREMFGSQDTGQPGKPNSGAPNVTASGSLKEKIDKLAALFQEIIDTSQAELIQTLRIELGLPGAPSPPTPVAPKRPRSRVSRKGRVRARNNSGR